jgi:LemA protein
MGIGLIIAIVVAAIVIVGAVIVFNGFVRGKNLVREAWSGIDVQLKRRHDLIPNIVETVKGYATHEREAFEKVAELRTEGLRSDNVKVRSDSENALTASIKTLFAVAEAYPDLKANENFLKLQDALIEVEDNIQYARRYYNGTVRDFNIRCEAFPSNIIAGIFGFRRQEYFEIELASERSAPELKLSGAG